MSTRGSIQIFFLIFIPFLFFISLVGGGIWVVEVQRHRQSLEKEATHKLGLLENAIRREVFSLALNPLFFAARMRTIPLDEQEWFQQVNQGMREINPLIRWLKEEPAYREVRIFDRGCRILWRVRRQNETVFAEREQPDQPDRPNGCPNARVGNDHDRIWVVHEIQENPEGEKTGLFETWLPVRTRLGEPVGAISVVFTLESLIKRMLNRFEFGGGHLFLLAPQGEWLFKGMIMPDGALRALPWQDTFYDRFPAVWDRAKTARRWHTRNQEDFLTLLDMDDARLASPRTPTSSGERMSEKELFFSGIRLAIHYPASLFDLPLWRDRLIILLCLFLPMGAVGSWQLALASTRRRSAEAALRYNATMLQDERNKLTTIILGAQEGIVVTDPKGEVVLINPAAERLLDKPGETIIQQGFFSLLDDPDYLTALLNQTGSHLPDIVVYKRRILKIRAVSITTVDGKKTGSAALLRDITEEKKLEDQLRNLSITDELTALLNRRRFDELLQEEMLRSKRYKIALGIILVDVDHFKRFNDQYGHDQGDRVLQAVAKTLRQSARDVDIVARYGGEEFILLLPNTNYPGANHVAERLRRAVEELLVDGLQVTISLGTAMYPVPIDGEVKDLVKVADQALYEAKHRGRNRVCFARTKEIIEELGPESRGG